MDEQQRRRVNEAAEQFATALRESYRAVSDRGVSAYELNVRLSEDFINQVINNLQTQAEDSGEMTRALADQQRRQEATQQLTRETAGGYIEFMNSLFSMARAAPEAARRAEERSR